MLFNNKYRLSIAVGPKNAWCFHRKYTPFLTINIGCLGWVGLGWVSLEK
jgi:hypothetical protein